MLFVCAVTFATETSPRIVLVGDSTMASGSGWGDAFGELLVDGVEFKNLAMGGRSSKSFRDEGRWDEVLELKPDWVLLQFGHNDEPGKGPALETDAETTFRENLKRYVEEIRALGGEVVLLTPMVRRNFGPDGRIDPNQLQPYWNASLGKHIPDHMADYATATRAVASELNVLLIDLHIKSIELANECGPERAVVLGPENRNPEQPDNTHLSSRGGVVIADLVAQAIRLKVPELAPLISF
ncbi:MAG: rhamnogalacturonan acetylesterase [Opitutales bacterium]|nr:rhamnogalacturonan acetylesterase [Opitutales bacterium]